LKGRHRTRAERGGNVAHEQERWNPDLSRHASHYNSARIGDAMSNRIHHAPSRHPRERALVSGENSREEGSLLFIELGMPFSPASLTF
jgi:hypothetical protein